MKLSKNTRQNLITSLISINFTVFLIFLYVWIADPLGLEANAFNQWFMQRQIIPHPTGYAYEQGVYTINGHHETILADGLRFVPDAVITSDCKIVFVGDSVTYGYGIDDTATFANLAAKEFGVNVLNAGRPAYNITQALAAVNYYPANAYVYLLTSNDKETPRNIPRSTNESPRNFILVYRDWLYISLGNQWREPYTEDLAGFQNALEDMQSRDNILTLTYGDTYPELGIVRIPSYPESEHNSVSDNHPNAEGNQTLFNGMRELIGQMIEEHC